MSCATVAVLASGLPEPTFLESGSNDLIRFQKGEVPAPPVTLEAAPSAAPEPVEPAEMRAPEHRLMDSEGAAAEIAPPPSARPQPPALAPAPADAPSWTDRMDLELDPVIGRTAPQRERVAPAAAPKQNWQKREATGADAQGLNSAIEKSAARRAQEPAPLEEAADADDAISARLVTVCLTNRTTPAAPRALISGEMVRRAMLPMSARRPVPASSRRAIRSISGRPTTWAPCR